MAIDERLAELPEAIPLYRVSPLWRFAALAGAFIVAALLFVSATLGLVVIGQNSAVRTPVPPPPKMMVAPTGWTGSVPQQKESDDLPYPTKQDLAEALLPEETQVVAAVGGARQRFLDKGIDTYQLNGQKPELALVSPDGQWLAYVFEGRLYGGPLDHPRILNEARYKSVRIGQGVMPAYFAGAEENPAVGVPAWWTDPLPAESSVQPSRDGNYVCCLDASGALRRFGLDETATLESTGWGDAVFPFHGGPLLHVPKNEQKLVFVRSLAQAKVETGAKPGDSDHTEVVLGELATGGTRVIIPASSATWQYLSISPDGKRLALVSDRGYEGTRPSLWRVFVVGLEGGEPEALSPPDAQTGPVCWTSDGSALVYARSQHPLPPENWQNEHLDSNSAMDLYLWDFGTNRETRLSRGGGFFSPSVTEDDELHYLTVVQGKSGPTSVLRHMTLAAAREFAAGEAETKPRDQKTWQAIVVEVLGSSSSEGKSNQPALTPARAARTADDFAKAYKDHFKAEAPASLQQLERLRLELAGFHWSAERQADCALVLGVVEGEFLVRHHGARWSLSKSPRIDGPSIAEEGEHENPFTIMVNPFAAAGAWLRAAKEAVNLSRILHQAGGRTIVLANDLSAVQPAIAGLSDPDLASAEKLFRDGAAEKAEALLVKMLEKKQYAGNHVLVIHAASLLERYGRTKVFRQVIEKECEAPFHDARRYNLLGIARLQEDPRGAVDAFSYALRCDLRFDAGYLNLALAYDRAGEPVKAQACLRRYLSMKPGGKYAADALRRLTAWGNRSAN